MLGAKPAVAEWAAAVLSGGRKSRVYGYGDGMRCHNEKLGQREDLSNSDEPRTLLVDDGALSYQRPPSCCRSSSVEKPSAFGLKV